MRDETLRTSAWEARRARAGQSILELLKLYSHKEDQSFRDSSLPQIHSALLLRCHCKHCLLPRCFMNKETSYISKFKVNLQRYPLRITKITSPLCGIAWFEFPHSIKVLRLLTSTFLWLLLLLLLGFLWWLWFY